ncbi:MAG: aminotransferase class V-fold PLP-dependent enzyme [Actinomycetota bacterium]
MALPDQSFGPFAGRVWLNAAHQGPLPHAAVAAARRALDSKTSPHLIADQDFYEVPKRLRNVLARLVGGRPDEVVLGNSATFGIQLIANGLNWREGDEVLVPAGDFPATVLPWTTLESKGVLVRELPSDEGIIDAGEVAEQLSERTRVLCASWVNSFSGGANDLSAVGSVCRDAGVLFVVNASQGLGALPLEVSKLPVDAITSCGFKWLCGPYGTGLCWLRPELRDRLDPHQAYWLSLGGEHWNRLDELARASDAGVERFDVFGTANFLNFEPWTAAVTHLLDAGVDDIAAHILALAGRLIDGVDPDRFRIVGAGGPSPRSGLVVIEPHDGSAERLGEDLAQAGFDVAVRRGRVRFSPHLYNSAAEIDGAFAELNRT